jgi:Lrp/AsnC family transcriptional regulator, regulator for asnA, asnC and gidA
MIVSITEAARMDDVDRAIAELLGVDGRMSSAVLARRLGQPEPTIRRRVQRLLAAGAIRVVAVVDPALTPDRVDALIGLKVDLSEVNHASAELAKRPELRYVGVSTGEFDILVEGVFASQQALHLFLTDCIGALAGVRDSRTFVILHTVKYGAR